MGKSLNSQLGGITNLDSENTRSVGLNGADITNAGDGCFTNVFAGGELLTPGEWTSYTPTIGATTTAPIPGNIEGYCKENQWMSECCLSLYRC